MCRGWKRPIISSGKYEIEVLNTTPIMMMIYFILFYSIIEIIISCVFRSVSSTSHLKVAGAYKKHGVKPIWLNYTVTLSNIG